jgi:hypothetical protein
MTTLSDYHDNVIKVSWCNVINITFFSWKLYILIDIKSPAKEFKKKKNISTRDELVSGHLSKGLL